MQTLEWSWSCISLPLFKASASCPSPCAHFSARLTGSRGHSQEEFSSPPDGAANKMLCRLQKNKGSRAPSLGAGAIPCFLTRCFHASLGRGWPLGTSRCYTEAQLGQATLPESGIGKVSAFTLLFSLIRPQIQAFQVLAHKLELLIYFF